MNTTHLRVLAEPDLAYVLAAALAEAAEFTGVSVLLRTKQCLSCSRDKRLTESAQSPLGGRANRQYGLERVHYPICSF